MRNLLVRHPDLRRPGGQEVHPAGVGQVGGDGRHRDDAKCVWCCCVLCASYGREGIGAGEEKEAIYFMGGVINAVT